ncbi:MAG: hypothetical protein ACE37M_15880 [Henriciella sp.]
MDEPSLDLERPHAIGALDRVTTNVAISLIAVIPTFLACIVTPWRLTELLKQDSPEGRTGMLLAPGAFFPLSLLISMTAGALLTTPELASNDGSFLGPNLALSIQSAVSDGDVWRAIGIVMPIYGFAVLAGSLGLVLRSWAHRDWNLRFSLRAVFYVMGTFVSWIIISSAVIDIVRASTRSSEWTATLALLISTPAIGIIFWMFFWFFHNKGELSWVRSGLLAGAMMALSVLLLVAIGVISDL